MKHLLYIGVVAFLLLTSSTGVMVHRHYCHGQLQKTGLFFPPKACCDDSKTCCDDQAESVRLEVEYLTVDFPVKFNLAEYETSQLVFDARLTGSNTLNMRVEHNFHYPFPPPIFKDRQVALQTFLF